jgi:hypothetical protein
MNWVRWVVRSYAAVCFVACVWVHAFTLSGQAVERMTPFFWACFVSVGAACWVFLPEVRAWKSPAVVLALLVGLGIVYTAGYWWVTRAVSGLPAEAGVPAGEECDRHLLNQGKRVRQLSEEEYQREVLTQSRQWTACYAVFSLFALMLTSLPGKPPADTPPAPPPAPDPPAG